MKRNVSPRILLTVIVFTSFVATGQLLKVKMHKANDYYVYNYLNQTNDEIIADPDEKETNIKMTTLLTINYTDSTVQMKKNGVTYLNLKANINKTPKGTIKKVTFGDPNMRVRNTSKARAKSFRARHKCSQKKDRTTAGYWSCNVSRYRKKLGLKSSRTW